LSELSELAQSAVLAGLPQPAVLPWSAALAALPQLADVAELPGLAEVAAFPVSLQSGRGSGHRLGLSLFQEEAAAARLPAEP
jgi:hypothetical protein